MRNLDPERAALAPLFLTRRPRGILARYIDMLWLWRGAMRINGKDRMLPTGAAGLIINLAEDETRLYDDAGRLAHRIDGAGFTGAHARSFVIDTAEQSWVIGAAFHPGGAWPFVESAQDELSNSHVALREVWGAGAASVRERLLLSPTPHAQLELLETLLVQQLQRPLLRHRAVELALAAIARDPGAACMRELSRRADVSTRRFARVFEQQVGLTPKLYARLMRFREVVRFVRTLDAVDWSDVAASCGYYDQSHFIRDFKAFSGFTPSAYLQLAGEFSNHVPIE